MLIMIYSMQKRIRQVVSILQPAEFAFAYLWCHKANDTLYDLEMSSIQNGLFLLRFDFTAILAYFWDRLTFKLGLHT